MKKAVVGVRLLSFLTGENEGSVRHTEIVCYHCDKFGIGGLPFREIYCIAEVFGQDLYITAIERDLY